MLSTPIDPPPLYMKDRVLSPPVLFEPGEDDLRVNGINLYGTVTCLQSLLQRSDDKHADCGQNCGDQGEYDDIPDLAFSIEAEGLEAFGPLEGGIFFSMKCVFASRPGRGRGAT